MFLHVLEARYVRDYVVWLNFSDGAAGEVDLSAELDGSIFGPLRDIGRFKQFSVACHTLMWPNGADFAPEFLRERVVATVVLGEAHRAAIDERLAEHERNPDDVVSRGQVLAKARRG